MKLINKKTGEIAEIKLKLNESLPDGIRRTIEEAGWEETREPLIKDEKIRKVFQEWVKLHGAEQFRAIHFFDSKWHTTLLKSTDLTTEPTIELPGHIGTDSEIYTRAELCGEEEPRPVIANDVKYSSYEDYLKSKGKK